MTSVPPPSAYLAYMNSAQRNSLLSKKPGDKQPSQSSSETDVSTSTETLNQEERYVLAHTQRQEPQGEETSHSLDASSCNTLIIHHSSRSSDLWASRSSSIHESPESNPHAYTSGSTAYPKDPLGDFASGNNSKMTSPFHSREGSLTNSSAAASNVVQPGNRISESGSAVQSCGLIRKEITGIPDDYLDQLEILKHLAKEVKVAPSSMAPGNSSPTTSQAPSQSSGYGSDQERMGSKSGLDYAASKLLPPPAYPQWRTNKFRSSNVQVGESISDKLTLSQSQPDLSTLDVSPKSASSLRGSIFGQRPKARGRALALPKGSAMCERDYSQSDKWPPSEMVEILMRENSALKLELENCYHKVACLQKFELELNKVHQAHEALEKSSERRENLERAARARLQTEVRRLQEGNRELRGQLETLAAQFVAQPMPDLGETSLRKEISKRDVLIAQLVSQNKEVTAAKERQDIELAAQRATLQEQRTHIEILDNALTNAQTNVMRLEEECRKKQMYMERVSQLQRALAALQLSSDRREQTERKLRQQLEKEIRDLRSSRSQQRPGKEDESCTQEEVEELKQQLRTAEERIMVLEGDVSKWEQRYLEENALRQAVIDAASLPKDAKIAALEQTSQESEKLIAEAQTEKFRHMDELHVSQKKAAELEARIKLLESKLAEKEAMIRVLQKHAFEKEGAALGNLMSGINVGRSPQHTPHPSLSASSVTDTSTAGTSASYYSSVTSALTSLPSSARPSISSSASSLKLSSAAARGSPSSSIALPPVSRGTDYLSQAMKYGAGSVVSTPTGSRREGDASFDSTKKSLDDQLKELDSQLLSKDSLIQALRRERERYPNHYWRV